MVIEITSITKIVNNFTFSPRLLLLCSHFRYNLEIVSVLPSKNNVFEHHDGIDIKNASRNIWKKKKL